VRDFAPERIDGFLEAGHNRFSIGIQSFDTKVRRSLGRHSDRETATRNLADLVSRDMGAVIIDLIYGLPFQTLSVFETDLEIAHDLGLDGLDTYQLNVFPKGDLKKAVDEGKLPPPAPLSEQGRYYLLGYERLLGKRWKTLSLSHYARTPRERNFYNPWAKRKGNALGVGAGAGGFLSSRGYYRLPDVGKYLENVENGDFSPSFLTLPSPREELTSHIVKELEVGSLNLAELRGRFPMDPKNLEILTRNYVEAGLARFDGDWFDLTPSGRFWGVNVTQAMCDTAASSVVV
jgi:oxygen-independent coproporphyrinogen-3 oxidase